MERKYYIRHVHSEARASAMEKELMKFCQQKVGFVMSENRLFAWSEEIRSLRNDLKRANPRIKEVEIRLEYNPRSKRGDMELSYIKVGEGYIGLDVVKGEED